MCLSDSDAQHKSRRECTNICSADVLALQSPFTKGDLEKKQKYRLSRLINTKKTAVSTECSSTCEDAGNI